MLCSIVALLAEGVDRNNQMLRMAVRRKKSPSSQRAWIEIRRLQPQKSPDPSPSSQRAWIEIDPT